MDLFLDEKPFSLTAEKKTRRYLSALTRLTDYHREHCMPYGRFVRSMGFSGCPADSPFLCGTKTAVAGEGMESCTEDPRVPSTATAHLSAGGSGADSTGMRRTLAALPFLPVSTFKERKLLSIPEEKIYKTITSSGTSGQKVSKIFLDTETSMRQQQVLSRIVSDFIGDKRLPLLILDCPQVLRDRALFSARGAGILGFSIFGKDRCFALTADMEPDFDAVDTFLKKHAGERILLFGFTYILWKQFICRLEEQGKRLAIPEGILIHGGGWKKLANEAVSREELKSRILRATDIRHVHEYYGMAEQTGCIYMECECGHLHASNWSDIMVRRPEDYGMCGKGEPGILQVMTPLAHSYPGHNLLTEDLGILLGEDDCPCGRMGKYFSVIGRIPKSEVRGCSDTFEQPVYTGGDPDKAAISGKGYAAADRSGAPGPGDTLFHIGEEAELLAGSRDPHRAVREVFSQESMGFISALSRAVLQDPQARAFPEIAAFGFWCRRAHLEAFRKRHTYLSTGRNEDADGSGAGHGGPVMDGMRNLGRGMAFHLTPANVPAMFAYSFVIGLLSGNSNIVRVSARTGQVGDILCRLIRETINDDLFRSVRESTAMIRYDRNDALTQRLMENAEVRVVWGSDETVRKMRQLPARPGAVDVLFPDRWSLALVSLRALSQMSDEEISIQARYFYNDTYIMDQRGCSSPQLVVFQDDTGKSGRPDAADRVPGPVGGSIGDPCSSGAGHHSAVVPKSAAGDVFRPEKDRFWKAVASIAGKEYEWDAFKSARKYEQLSLFLLENGREELRVRRYAGNLLQVIDLGSLPPEKREYRGGFGLFFEAEIKKTEELLPMLTPKVQTLSCIGVPRKALAELLIRNRAEGIDRIVPAGQALQMDTVWDGRDLIAQMSRAVV